MQITLPKNPKIKEQDKNRAVFEIEELYPGYGVTIGNALRRVLYSSLPGAAITQVKIKKAPHEFSTLPGVLEDLLEVTLNLKQVYIKMHGDEAQSATIKIKGVRKVTAADIVCPSQIEVINKDAHIATLTSKDAKFEAEFLIEAGFGYVTVEQRMKTGAEIGSIPLDAIFTPIRKVNFEIENMRIGDRTDYNRLRLEIVTNGTISPQEAMTYASNLLVQHFQSAGFVESKEKEKGGRKTKTKTSKVSKAKISAKKKAGAKKTVKKAVKGKK